MIYTITLNPALDHYLEVDDLTVDDANRVKSECLYAGGKGIDVSRAIRHLGGDSMALGFIGGHNGQVLLDLLKREGVTTYFTPIAQETRRDIIVNNRKAGTQTMLNARGPTVTAEEWRSFLEHLRLLDLRDAYVVLGGSLPRGVALDAYYQIVRLVQRRGAKAVLDADGPCLKAGLKARPFAIKPNVKELQRVSGRPLRTEADILAAATALNRGGVNVVLVSRGRQGLLVVSGTRHRSPLLLRAVPPPVKVRSTVGAGDSTVAGFVFRHAGGKTVEDAVRYATAAGTAATLAPGNQLCRLIDVQRLVPRVKIEQLRSA
ncbi:MAG: 1-phosphofructokinase [Nitrospirae bacterium]|nr:MAG: 1-phosphofructokinase [Nitrospirota bacterium]